MTLVGTSHFEDTLAARNFYKPYGYDDLDKAIRRKLRDGEIFIGRPQLKPNQRLVVIKGRYHIEEK